MRATSSTAEHLTINIKVLSLPIEITTNYRPLLKEFHNLTSALVSPANGESPAVRFRVIQKRKYTHIERDGRALYRTDKDFLLCQNLIEEIRASCYEHVRDYLLLHAGAVVKNGKTTILPAKSQGGKTTLTLGLMDYGYRYLTDEVSVIHRETLEVVPYQRPICVVNWSRPLRQEAAKDFRVYQYRGKNGGGRWERWQFLVPQGGAILPRDARWKVDHIVFPSYTPEGKAELRLLSTAQAVMALMQRCWNPQLFPDGGLRICAGLARRAKCYTLEMGNLETACELIENLHVKAC